MPIRVTLDQLIVKRGLKARDLAQQVGMAVPDDPTDPAEQQRALQARAHQATLSEVLELSFNRIQFVSDFRWWLLRENLFRHFKHCSFAAHANFLMFKAHAVFIMTQLRSGNTGFSVL